MACPKFVAWLVLDGSCSSHIPVACCQEVFVALLVYGVVARVVNILSRVHATISRCRTIDINWHSCHLDKVELTNCFPLLVNRSSSSSSNSNSNNNNSHNYKVNSCSRNKQYITASGKGIKSSSNIVAGIIVTIDNGKQWEIFKKIQILGKLRY